jgi:hypothetical protein
VEPWIQAVRKELAEVGRQLPGSVADLDTAVAHLRAFGGR